MNPSPRSKHMSYHLSISMNCHTHFIDEKNQNKMVIPNIYVSCLATDACLTAIPGVASSIPARSHTFVEIDHEIISTVILLPSTDSFKKGCCQFKPALEKVWLGELTVPQ